MPTILTSDEWGDLLSEDVLGRSDLPVRVDRAEWRVVHRYRDRAAVSDTELYFDEPLGQHDSPGIVHLRGWAETDAGEPDPGAMPDGLVRRLRVVIAKVVEWRLHYEKQEGIASKSQGSRSVSYDDLPSLPTRLFAPLRPYDERAPMHGFW